MLKIFIVSCLTMLVIDGVWLFVMFRLYYKNKIGHIMADKMDFLAGGIFYLLYNFGLTYLIIMPLSLADNSVQKIFVEAALFGAVAYATYDLTNKATIKGWPWSVTLVDILWGAVMTGTVALITLYIV